MEFNDDTRDHKDEFKEEKYKIDFEKMGKFTSYPQHPMGFSQMQGCPVENCPMHGNPMYCPMFQAQPYSSVMPWQMRDEAEDYDFNGYRRRPFYPRPFYPGPYYYPRPYFYPRPYYPGPNPFLFLLPFFL